MAFIRPPCYSVDGARTITVFGLNWPWMPKEGYDVTNQHAIDRNADLPVENARPLVGPRLFSGGESLFEMEPLQDVRWMEVDLRPVGSIPATVEQYENGEIKTGDVSAGIQWTPFKARITWQEESGCEISEVVDIGQGRVFSVPPTNKVSVHILTPRLVREDDGSIGAATILNAAAPPGIVARSTFVASQIHCKVTCVQDPSGLHAKFSQAFYLCRATDFDTAQFVIPRGTQRMQLRYSNGITGGPIPADAFTADLAPEFERFPQGTRPGPLPLPIPRIPVPAGGVSPDEMFLYPPSMASAVRLFIPGGSAVECVNVIVTAELDL